MAHASTITLARLQQSGAYRQIQDSNKLTEGEREEALENLVSILDQDIDLGIEANSIEALFVWMDSEQGFGYWDKLYGKLYGKIQR